MDQYSWRLISLAVSIPLLTHIMDCLDIHIIITQSVIFNDWIWRFLPKGTMLGIKGTASLHPNLVPRAMDTFFCTHRALSFLVIFSILVWPAFYVINRPTPFPLQKKEQRKSLSKDLKASKQRHFPKLYSPAPLLEEIASDTQPRSCALFLPLSFEQKKNFLQSKCESELIYFWFSQMEKKS